jgi:hypothetical protein
VSTSWFAGRVVTQSTRGRAVRQKGVTNGQFPDYPREQSDSLRRLFAPTGLRSRRPPADRPFTHRAVSQELPHGRRTRSKLLGLTPWGVKPARAAYSSVCPALSHELNFCVLAEQSPPDYGLSDACQKSFRPRPLPSLPALPGAGNPARGLFQRQHSVRAGTSVVRILVHSAG